jgi:hypothetical protein
MVGAEADRREGESFSFRDEPQQKAGHQKDPNLTTNDAAGCRWIVRQYAMERGYRRDAEQRDQQSNVSPP